MSIRNRKQKRLLLKDSVTKYIKGLTYRVFKRLLTLMIDIFLITLLKAFITFLVKTFSFPNQIYYHYNGLAIYIVTFLNLFLI